MEEKIEVKRKKDESAEKAGVVNKILKSKFLPWIVVAVVLVAGAGAAYYYKDQADKVKSDPATVQKEKNQAETDRIMAAVSKALLINEKDKPTVARIEDPAKLQKSNADFYKDAQKGDYLIIYPKRALIYRESNNQIVNIAPIINTSDLKKDEGTTPASETNPVQ